MYMTKWKHKNENRFRTMGRRNISVDKSTFCSFQGTYFLFPTPTLDDLQSFLIQFQGIQMILVERGAYMHIYIHAQADTSKYTHTPLNKKNHF